MVTLGTAVALGRLCDIALVRRAAARRCAVGWRRGTSLGIRLLGCASDGPGLRTVLRGAGRGPTHCRGRPAGAAGTDPAGGQRPADPSPPRAEDRHPGCSVDRGSAGPRVGAGQLDPGPGAAGAAAIGALSDAAPAGARPGGAADPEGAG